MTKKQESESRRSAGRLRIRRARMIDLEHLVRQRREMWMEIGVKGKQKLDRADREYRTWVRNGFRKRTLIGWMVEDDGGSRGWAWLCMATTDPAETGNPDLCTTVSSQHVHRTALSRKGSGYQDS